MKAISKAPLGDVAEFIRGVTFKPDDVVPPEAAGSVWCMRTKNVQAQIDLSDLWAIDESLVKRRNQYLQPGDVLISSANSWNLVGKCCWVPQLERASTFGGFISALRANPDRVLPRYLYHWFSAPKIQATVRSFGRQTTNISNLDIKRCLDMPIQLPPMDVQRKVADSLDRTDALRVKRRKAIALLDDLAESIFLDMFGDPVSNPKNWDRRPLTEVCRAYSGGTPSKAKAEYWSGGLPWFSAKDLKSENLVDSKDHISERVPQESNLRLLPADTVVIVVRGMILKHTFPVSMLKVPATINQDLKALLPIVDLNSDFLAACLRVQSNYILRQVSTAAHGTTRLDSDGLRKVEIIIPPRALQGDFASRVAQKDRVAASHRASLQGLDELFGSLQQRAFRGELWED